MRSNEQRTKQSRIVSIDSSNHWRTSSFMTTRIQNSQFNILHSKFLFLPVTRNLVYDRF